MQDDGNGCKAKETHVLVFVDIGGARGENSVELFATSQEEPDGEDAVDGRNDTQKWIPHEEQGEGQCDIVSGDDGTDVFEDVIAVALYDSI